MPAVPAVLAGAAFLVLPGLVLGALSGLRGLTMWGSAPVLSGAVVGIAAVVAGQLGITWSWLVVVVATVGLGLLAFLVSRLTGSWRSPHVTSATHSRRQVAVVVLVGLLASSLLQVRRMLTAIGTPDAVAQTFDTSYHLNSVRLMLESGDASSLHMVLTTPGKSLNFYPGLWHGFCALVVELSGADVATSANALSVVIAGLVWPLSLLALARAVFGPRPVLLGMTAFLSFAMVQFPNTMLSFGILYPNLLAYAYVPAVLGLLVLALWKARGMRRTVPFLLAGVGCVALVLAQPNALFALGYLLVPLGLQWTIQRSAQVARTGPQRWKAALPPALFVGVCVAAYWAAGQVAMVATFREQVSWPVRSTWQEAIRAVLDLSAMHPQGTANPVLAVLVVIGFAAAIRVSRWRWLAGAYLLLAALFVVVASVDTPLRAQLTGYWYGDPQRLASLLPIIGLLLASIGAACVVCALSKAFEVWRRVDAPRFRVEAWRCLATVLIGALVVVVLPRTDVYAESFLSMSSTYQIDPDSESSVRLVDEHEYRLMDELPEIVPEGVVVVGNPWDGSAMSWALGEREALFPHMGEVVEPDRFLVATALNQALVDPAVCEAVDRLNVGYVLRMGRHLWGGNPIGYEGLDGLVENGVGELVAQEGNARLYKITACDD
ncbi:DUF6541 family protein [Oerskovia enterophila]|uniref:DUF6541 family protein n=1 Tax=Oerskovia enterophila TaxID=43678 RepID=UPI0037F547DD